MSEEKKESTPSSSQNQNDSGAQRHSEKPQYRDSVLETVRRNIKEGMETAQRNIQQGKVTAQRNIQQGKVTASRNIKEGMQTARRNVVHGYHTAEENIRNGTDTALRNIAEGAETARRNIAGTYRRTRSQEFNETVPEEGSQESQHGAVSSEIQSVDTKTPLAPPPSLPPVSHTINASQDNTHNEIEEESLQAKISRLERRIDERGLVNRPNYIS